MNDLKRFEEKYIPEPNSGCWLWTASTVRNGYGRFVGWSGAHRASYELYCEPIPSGMHILHKCDNPACVNPDHLFLGTNSDNQRDMDNKSRRKLPPPKYGRDNPSSRKKLTESQILSIRDDSRSYEDISTQYSITTRQVHRMKIKEQWKWL